jgi:hypothetical protein
MGRKPLTQEEAQQRVTRKANSMYSNEEQAFGTGKKLKDLKDKGGCKSWMWFLLLLAAIAVVIITAGA